MPPSLADFIYAKACKPICEKLLTLPYILLWGVPFSLGVLVLIK